VQFRVLGSVEVWSAGQQVDVGHAKQRCVLTVLVMAAGQVVPAATLMDRVWGNDPPDGALNVLYAYVCRLRKAVAPIGVQLARRSGGYVLDIRPDEVDVYRFRRLVAEADQQVDPDRVVATLDEALALWRSTALTGVAGPWAEQVRELLDEERVAALIRRNEAYLDAGRHVQAVRQMRELLAARPDDERVVVQLMTALHRAGWAAEACRQYRLVQDSAARHGSLPSRRLRELHGRILRDDPTPVPSTAAPHPGGLLDV
jgi:DNA-binding SARP family transcriptional activator